VTINEIFFSYFICPFWHLPPKDVYRMYKYGTNVNNALLNFALQHSTHIKFTACVRWCVFVLRHSPDGADGHLRGGGAAPLLQQEQDRGTLANRQVLLLPRPGGGDHQGRPLLRGWYVPNRWLKVSSPGEMMDRSAEQPPVG